MDILRSDAIHCPIYSRVNWHNFIERKLISFFSRDLTTVVCDIIIDESTVIDGGGGGDEDSSTSHHELVYTCEEIDEQNEYVKYDCAMDDEDMFLLSFAPSLARMTRKQNGQARLRILEYLYKLEFEED